MSHKFFCHTVIVALLLPCWPFEWVAAQNADIQVLRTIHLHRNTQWDGFFVGCTKSAIPLSIAAPVALISIGWQQHNPQLTRQGIKMGLSLIGSAGISAVLKYSIQKPRPAKIYPDIIPLQNEQSPSFPSAHTAFAFATATSISLSFPKWYVAVPAYTWAGLVGYSRLHLGVHYPSDVLAGALIGSATAWVCYKGNKWLHKNKKGFE